MSDSHLTSVGGICTMQTTTTIDWEPSQETLDRWAEESRQKLSCWKALGLTMGEQPIVIHHIEGVK